MVIPYLTFYGRCREAMDFYQNVFQCEEPKVLPYGDYIPDGLAEPPQNLSQWIMRAEMTICGTNFWFADEAVPVSTGSLIRLTVTVSTAKEAARIFDALSNGSQISLPPTETFYSAFHTALTDKFGVCWNIVAEEAPAQSLS